MQVVSIMTSFPGGKLSMSINSLAYISFEPINKISEKDDR